MGFGKALPSWEGPHCSSEWHMSKWVQAPCPEDGGVVSIVLVLPLSFSGCLKQWQKTRISVARARPTSSGLLRLAGPVLV